MNGIVKLKEQGRDENRLKHYPTSVAWHISLYKLHYGSYLACSLETFDRWFIHPNVINVWHSENVGCMDVVQKCSNGMLHLSGKGFNL